MQKQRSNRKRLAKQQSRLIDSLEGIGDILVFETKRLGRNKIVAEGLSRLRKIIKQFLDLQTKNPDKFERLLLAQDFFDIYSKNQKEAGLRLSFSPERYLISFFAAINQVLRIHRIALETENEEISRLAASNLNAILADTALESGREVIVEQMLTSIRNVLRLAVKRQDTSMYSAAINWYTSTVFEHSGESRFRLEYLDVFDRYFFSTIRFIVSENHSGLFKALVSSLVDGIHTLGHDSADLWEYGHLLLRSNFETFRELNKKYDIDKTIGELIESQKDLDTKEKLTVWFDKFSQLKSMLEPSFTPTEAKKAAEIEKQLRETTVLAFKFNNLLEMVFGLGAFCLFKGRIDFIDFLWEYKQPTDSDASWGGEDIVPRDLNELVRFYFRKDVFQRRFSFWEDHHGSEGYYKKYFILLLLNILRKTKKDDSGKYPEIENFSLPKLSVYRYSDIEYSTNELIQITKDFCEQKPLFQKLRFDPNEIDELLTGKALRFLENLKRKSSEQMALIHRNGKMSQGKIEGFRNEFKETFYKNANMRKIFMHYGKFKMEMRERNSEKLRLGVYQLDDKAVFFDEWHVHYGNWGEGYGQNLASGENKICLDEIKKRCALLKGRDLEELVREFSDLSSVIILTTSPGLYRVFEHSQKFKPEWQSENKNLDFNNFEGWYQKDEFKIPVFRVHGQNEAYAMALDTKTIGHFIQLNPLFDKETEEHIFDVFYFRIIELEEDAEMVEKILNDAPEWLQKIGNRAEQKESLREKVAIHLGEKIRFEADKNFKGFVMDFPKEDSSELP